MPQPTRYSLYWGTDDNVEDINRYTTGGYHPIRLGDILESDTKSYHLIHKLGRGSFSTVWLARTLNDAASSPKFVALKICVADAHPQQELKVHSRLPIAQGRHVLQLFDKFSLRGPNGTHVVLVHDVLGSFLDLPDLVQTQTRQNHILIFANLNKDIHPGNIGVCLPTLEEHSENDILNYFGPPEITPILPRQPPPRPEALPPYLVPPISLAYYLKKKDPSFVESSLHVEIMDLGNATIADEPPCPSCTPATVCAPEILFERVTTKTNPPATFASDIWSLACTLYEIVFRTRIFHFASYNDALMEDMAKLCGEIPQAWLPHLEAEFLNNPISENTADAEWKRRLDPCTHGWMAADEAAEFGALLRTMLKMDASARPSAVEVLRHPWFKSC